MVAIWATSSAGPSGGYKASLAVTHSRQQNIHHIQKPACRLVDRRLILSVDTVPTRS